MTIFPRLNRTLLIATSALALAAAAPAGASSLSVIYQPTDEPGPVTLLPPVPVKTGVISGTPQGGQGSGDLFLLTQNKKSQTYTRTTIYTFANANAPVDGSAPSPNLVADKKGNIWGTTQGNGANGNGTLYELVAPATRKGAYTFRLVMQMPAQFTHEFAGDGFDQLAFDTKGNLFGLIRGDLNGTGLGGIFEVTKAQLASGNGAPALLYTFPSSDDSLPYGLAIDQHGNMFGVEPRGGSVPIDDYYAGALWEVSPPAKKGGAYTRQNIYNFCSIVGFNGNCIDGWLPMGGVSIGPNGTVYGTTFSKALIRTATSPTVRSGARSLLRAAAGHGRSPLCTRSTIITRMAPTAPTTTSCFRSTRRCCCLRASSSSRPPMAARSMSQTTWLSYKAACSA